MFLPVVAPSVTRAKMSRLWGGKKAKPKGDKCSFCHHIIAKDKTHSGMFYTVAASDDDEGGPIHSVRRLPFELRLHWAIAAGVR